MLEEGLFDPAKPLQIRQGDLPHWRQDGALYFVTFRLSDSLPQVLLEKWRRELEEWRREHEEAGHESLMQHSLEQQRHIERWLDRGYGSRILADPQAKQIVTDTICHFNGDRYELGDFVVAANHVHVLLRMAFAVELSDVLYSWKRFSSTALRRMAWVRRAFDAYEHLWQAESFDHIVRNPRSLDKISQYIRRHNESEAW